MLAAMLDTYDNSYIGNNVCGNTTEIRFSNGNNRRNINRTDNSRFSTAFTFVVS
ncbi:hypothetical protein Phum_PHUM057080 [Pediculus humanus corporis]|uniref:Uncharacterized protein n=1 Tax=Pediculus humanus subsp. corporis TaxID=121224 RepID=E0VBC3_PEDHC|nr:uncharacterized protein Phum_PHUM057080 [Pediculus humanus corporis]EEB10679.1 hypothetical protein Phum_PHUM057080 [Pediculus humanus corporis]